MATRTALLNGNVINRDTDFSKYIESLSEPGVIEGFTVTASAVAPGKARVPCERANGDVIYALVYNNASQEISGDGDVYIEISQEIIDNGELGNEDGTGIATIEVGTMPSSNALKLATITSGVVSDERNMIKTVGDLDTLISALDLRMTSAEGRIDALEAQSAVGHLEEVGLVGEAYTVGTEMLMQHSPTYENCTIDGVNIGDTNDNKEIHIQRIGSGVASNTLKLKLKMDGSPTTGLVVEVRRGVEVSVSTTESYWYGNELVCSGTIGYSGFTSDYQEFTVTMDGNFGGTEGELLDIVLYQTGSIVNASNYYVVACDSTQASECFSLVSVNGTTRTRSKYAPYCFSTGFKGELFAKMGTMSSVLSTSISRAANAQYQTTRLTETYTTTQAFQTLYLILSRSANIRGSGYADIKVNVGGTDIIDQHLTSGSGGTQTVKLTNVANGTVITLSSRANGSSGVSGGTTYYTKVEPTLIISGSQPLGARPLIITEQKSLGEQARATSFGRLWNGEWYGEFDGEVYTTATTGSITLGNCLGFKIIRDAKGDQYKIPFYGL